MAMATFVAVYHGQTISTAKLVALSADPQLVEEFVANLLPTNSAKSPRKDGESRANEVVSESEQPALSPSPFTVSNLKNPKLRGPFGMSPESKTDCCSR